MNREKRDKDITDGNLNAAGISPPLELLNGLRVHYQNGQLIAAEKLARRITQEFPNHQFTWKVLGAVLSETGRQSEAIKANQMAVTLSPQDAEAHSNLGVTLTGLGRLHDALASFDQATALETNFSEAHNNKGITLQALGRLNEAVVSFNQAISLQPDFTEAHYNLGITLKALGRLHAAEVSYRKAIALKPNYAEAHNNLGVTLNELGRLEEAVASCCQAMAFKPDFSEAYISLGIALGNVRFKSANPNLYAPLIRLLTNGNFARPKDVAKSILSLLKQDIQIKNLPSERSSTVSLDEVAPIIRSLNKLPLLHHLMRLCPLPELQFEELFVMIRSLLLKNLNKMEVSSELVYFLSTLSIHCFTNEYVYSESDEESYLIDELQVKISLVLAQSKQPEAIEILCLAAYRPLHRYAWCQKLESLDNLKEVKKRLIEEPLLEKTIAKDIPVLEEISNHVSLKVRGQYEENPYPRWVKLGIPVKAQSIAAVCAELKLQLHPDDIRNTDSPTILIAGCGTGQHSIETASRFSNCHVTAVDLSLSSLAYAKRKTNELGFTNVDYLQADILHLHQLGKGFDIIESGGVLHHMHDPMAGWRVLVDLLNPGGLMKIGVYSELARQHILEIREEIAALRVERSAADIRKFRKSLAESHEENHQRLTKSSDFLVSVC